MKKDVIYTVGITSIGAGVGQSVVDACRLSGLPLKVVGMGANPFAFGAFDCDVQDVLPNIYMPDYIDVLYEKCKAHHVQVLIPGLDDELIPLARNLDLFAADGIEVIVSGERLLKLCNDKEHMSRHLSKYSTSFVESMGIQHAHDLNSNGSLSFPLIAKPRAGFASRGIIVINGPEDLKKITSDHVIQTIASPHKGDIHHETFMRGLEHGQIEQTGEVSAQLVFGKDGNEIGRMVTYNKLTNGIPVEIIPMKAPEVWSEIDRLIPHFLDKGLRGPLNIQGRITDEGPRFFEMNARFTGITGLRAMLGFNEVEAIIRDAVDSWPRPRKLSCNGRRIGIRQVANRTVDVDLDPTLSDAVKLTGYHIGIAKGLKVLVSGANSFLGRATVELLLKTRGVEEVMALVRDVSRFSDGREPSLPEGAVIWNLEDLYGGTLSLGSIDVLVHLASGRPVHKANVLSDSLRFTRDLMTLAAKHHVSGIINASSQSVYGLSRQPLWDEEMEPMPETPYAQAKWASELMASMARRINNTTAVTSIRFAQLVGLGTGMRWTELPHLFIQKAVQGDSITVRGGQQSLDYLNVRDAAILIAQLIILPFKSWPSVLNVGSGSPVKLLSYTELVNKILKEMLDRKVTVDVNPDSIHLELGMNIDAARGVLGWSPSISMEETVCEIFTYLLSKDQSEIYCPPRFYIK